MEMGEDTTNKQLEDSVCLQSRPGHHALWATSLAAFEWNAVRGLSDNISFTEKGAVPWVKHMLNIAYLIFSDRQS